MVDNTNIINNNQTTIAYPTNESRPSISGKLNYKIVLIFQYFLKKNSKINLNLLQLLILTFALYFKITIVIVTIIITNIVMLFNLNNNYQSLTL